LTTAYKITSQRQHFHQFFGVEWLIVKKAAVVAAASNCNKNQKRSTGYIVGCFD